MNREWQVIYRARLAGGVEFGPPQVLDGVIAAAADQVEAMLQTHGFVVLKVTPTRAVVDWAKPNFDREEAAEFFCITSKTLTNVKGAGDIPFAQLGNGIYPRVLLEEFVKTRLNKAGQEIQKDLERAA